MNEQAYDISHLLESEPATPAAPERRMARTLPPTPAKPTVMAAEDALAREFLQFADAHEAMIQQYQRMTAVVGRGTYRK